MAAEPGDLLDALGPRLRERRAELGRTLASVAREAELSTSHLSAIESGGSVPSLAVLARVAHALGLSLNAVLRAASALPVRTGRLAARPGAHRSSAPELRLRVVTLVAAAGDEGAAPLEGEGPVFVHVREGELELGPHRLGDGDSLHADAAPAWRSPGRSVSLWVLSR